MAWRMALLLSVFGFSSVCAAAETKNLEISIYNNNLALVKDTRDIELTTGKNNIAFEGVATQIKPESVILVGDGINVLEQNYNYDLITPQNMIEKSVGQEVKTVILNPENGKNIFDKAKIVSANYGNPVLQFEYGIEPNFPGRVVFDNLPASLQSKPTLEAKIYSVEAGLRELSLAYLTNGISWKTNYVAKVNADNLLDLTGWVTINNQSGIDYQNAKVQLIAGEVNQVVEPRAMPTNGRLMMAKMAMAETASYDAVAGGAPQQISGYQLYTLPEKTDIKDNQTKQISLIEKNGVKYVKEGRINSSLYFNGNNRAEFEKEHPSLFYVVKNVEEDNLGIPLPSGVVRFYENDEAGSLQFIGEDSISHVAKGEKMELNLGSLFNVFVDGKITNVNKVSETKTSSQNNCNRFKVVRNYDVTVTFNNGGNTAEDVVFKQHLNQNTKVIKTNLGGTAKNINLYEWRVNVPVDGKFELKYVVQNTDTERRCD